MASKRPEYRVLVLGAAQVGKTALVRQFISNYFSTGYDPTGDDYRKVISVDGSDCIVEVDEMRSAEEEKPKLFDLYLRGPEAVAERKNFQKLFDLYVRGAEAFVLVYSVVERVSFVSIRTLMADVEKVREPTKPAPMVLMGNKIDSVAPTEVSTEEGAALAEAIGASFVEVSAKESTNVDEAFYLAVRLIRRQRMVNQEAEHRSPAVVGNKANGKSHKHRRCEIL